MISRKFAFIFNYLEFPFNDRKGVAYNWIICHSAQHPSQVLLAYLLMSGFREIFSAMKMKASKFFSQLRPRFTSCGSLIFSLILWRSCKTLVIMRLQMRFDMGTLLQGVPWRKECNNWYPNEKPGRVHT